MISRPPRLLIVGCGDVLKRAIPWLRQRFRVYVLYRRAESACEYREAGCLPIYGDLDQPASLKRLRGLADAVLYGAPPYEASGLREQRLERLLACLKGPAAVRQSDQPPFVYISTSGVYGDCAGALINETRKPHPESARAQRRVKAEQCLRRALLRGSVRPILLRAPGIYAANRLPIQRLQIGTPTIRADQDSYSNHIHADDLAMACCLALFRIKPGRAYHISDDSHWTMGDWFEKVADALELPRPPRLPRAEIEHLVSPMLWSFMRESRRLSNARMKQELGLRLRWPTPAHLLDQLRSS